MIDPDRFTAIFDGVMELYGKQRSDIAIALWLKLLEPFEPEAIEAALADHARTCRFAPTPADIIERISGADGRPSPDEAWSMIPRSETESVIWTDEMATAYAVAAPLLEANDAVAARRAFIDRYTKAVADARKQRLPLHVTPSWGWDASGRSAALDKAITLGLLSADHAKLLLPHYDPRGLHDSLPALDLPKLQ